MLELLKVLLAGIASDGIDYISTFISLQMVESVMYAERSISEAVAGADFSGVFMVTYSFGMALVVLKFLKKGADIYLIATDGDATNEPTGLFMELIKAIVVIVAFPTLYDWLYQAVSTLTNDLLAVLSFQVNIASVAASIVTLGIFPLIIMLIFLILYVVLFVQFVMRGIEILILRAGLPLAAVGLMDADGGIFASYAKKFFQSALTVIVQLFLAKLAIALLVSFDTFWALGAILMAIKTPRFLNEFMLTSGGVNVYQSMQMARIMKGVIRRK